MHSTLIQNTQKAIFYTFLILTVSTPLIFSTQNSELFEVPKMLFVYLGAAIILFLTLVKFTLLAKITFPKNAAFIGLLVLLGTQTVSTFFSIDTFTSVFGYPSRLNGGLISQFAFAIIFVGALVSLNKERIKTLLLAFVLTAFVVSLWGIPSHFGKDPNCLVLSGRLTSNCWQADFDPTQRIFSTLGQPNWLASYLLLALPIALAFILEIKRRVHKIFFTAAFLTILSALFFTNSISGFLGLLTSIVVFVILSKDKLSRKNAKYLLPLLLIPIITLALYSNTLFKRISDSTSKLLELSGAQSIETIETPRSAGTPSFLIRLIVWQGAIDIVKKNPIFGSGPETFAYSYYQSRPLAHNKTSEWNFFYNKAHNEVLNYFANSGIIGGLSYLAFISISLFFLFKSAVKKSPYQEISKATLAAVIGYLTSILSGFSVVATQLMMFLLIAYVLTLSNRQNLTTLNIKPLKKTPAKNVTLVIISLFALFLITYIGRLYFADILFQRAKNLSAPRNLTVFTNASNTHPAQNPFFFRGFSDIAFCYICRYR